MGWAPQQQYVLYSSSPSSTYFENIFNIFFIKKKLKGVGVAGVWGQLGVGGSLALGTATGLGVLHQSKSGERLCGHYNRL